MKVLITGITGFVGSHLAEYVLSKGAEVYGSVRWRSKTENIDHIKSRINLIECDLGDSSSVTTLIAKSKPGFYLSSRRTKLCAHLLACPGGNLNLKYLRRIKYF